jgi:hypothetical protein
LDKPRGTREVFVKTLTGKTITLDVPAGESMEEAAEKLRESRSYSAVGQGKHKPPEI